MPSQNYSKNTKTFDVDASTQPNYADAMIANDRSKRFNQPFYPSNIYDHLR